MAELGLLRFGSDAERAEHFRLQIRLMNSNTAATDFDPVQNDIVGFSPNLAEPLFVLEQTKVIRFGPGEWMMHCVPFPRFMIALKQGKFSYPKEIELFRAGGQFLIFSHTQAQASQNFTRNLPFIRGEQNQIALFNT